MVPQLGALSLPLGSGRLVTTEAGRKWRGRLAGWLAGWTGFTRRESDSGQRQGGRSFLCGGASRRLAMGTRFAFRDESSK